jgi:hypothetical protein
MKPNPEDIFFTIGEENCDTRGLYRLSGESAK